MNKINYNLSKEDTLLVKGVAICLMLWHHLFYQTLDYGDVVYQIALFGKVCVALFLFLSFYGLTIQYEKIKDKAFIETIKFVIKRFVKFYFNYWVIFLIFVPLGVFVFGRELSAAYDGGHPLKMIFTDFLGINGYFSYNMTWWFNQLIVYLYLLFPLLYFLVKKGGLISLLLGVIVWEVNFPVLLSEAHTWLLHVMLGILFALNVDKISRFLNKFNIWLLGGITIIVFLALFFVRNYAVIPYFGGTRVDALLAPVIVLLVILFLRNVKYVNNVFLFLGKHSMNIFLIHTFIFYYWFNDFIYSFKNPFLIFLVLIAVCTIISILLEFLKKTICLADLIKKLTVKIEKITL